MGLRAPPPPWKTPYLWNEKLKIPACSERLDSADRCVLRLKIFHLSSQPDAHLVGIQKKPSPDVGCLAPKHGRGCLNASAQKNLQITQPRWPTSHLHLHFPKLLALAPVLPPLVSSLGQRGGCTKLPKCRKTHSPLDMCFQIVTNLCPKHHPCHNLPLPPSFP